MKEPLRQSGNRAGHSLGEMLVALVIGAMVLTAVLTIYNRANQAAEAVLARIDQPTLAEEVLQRLAEDLNRVLGAEQDVTIRIRNGFDNGYARAELVLRQTMRDGKNEEQTFREITWRGGYDYSGSSSGLIIYRGYEGIDPEDKLLDSRREGWESNYPLVPLCSGVTFFRIEVPRGDDFVDLWSAPTLPPGIRVTLSFGEPYETVQGTLDVPDEEKIVRTIAVDKSRKIKFVMPAVGQGAADPNAESNVQTPGGESGGTAGRTTGTTPWRSNETPGRSTPGRPARR